jgi:hypothetical protein
MSTHDWAVGRLTSLLRRPKRRIKPAGCGDAVKEVLEVGVCADMASVRFPFFSVYLLILFFRLLIF